MPRSSKFNAKDYNFVAKRIRENFPTKIELTRDRRILFDLACDFARAYKKDNELFDPLKFLDACSPDVDLFPLSELWEDDSV